MRGAHRLPAAALVLLVHAGLLVLLWGQARQQAPLGTASVELRLIAPVAAAPRPAARTAPWRPVALPQPAPAPIAISLSPTAPSEALPIEANGAAVVAAVADVPPPVLATPVISAPTEPPRPARRAACAPAAHPPLLRERGIEGLVRLRVWVDELGRAGEVLLTGSSGYRLFDEAAIAQARRCPYEAAWQQGRAVASWVEFPIRFALDPSAGGVRDAQP